MKRVLAALVAALVVGGLFATAATAHTGAARRLRFERSDTGSGHWQGNRVDSPLDTAPNNSRLAFSVAVQDGDDYAAAYANGTGLGGKLLSDVRNISFDFLPGAVSSPGTGVRFSIPIDENDDGDWDSFLFAAARDCASPLSGGWMRADFTGQTAPGCTIYHGGVTPYTSDGTDSAWKNFADANPTFKTAEQGFQVAFLILDEEGQVFVDRLAMHNHMFVANGSNTNAIKHCRTEGHC